MEAITSWVLLLAGMGRAANHWKPDEPIHDPL